MDLSKLNIKQGLCISLGANINSQFGSPIDSLIKSRYEIEKIIKKLINTSQKVKVEDNQLKDFFKWSSLYRTKPLGITKSQPDYINCLLLSNGPFLPNATTEKAKYLLNELKNLEKEFGRNKSLEVERWLPRTLDLDIIWWDNLSVNDEELIIPHPRFKLRNFVITPLSEILSTSQEIEKLNIKSWK